MPSPQEDLPADTGGGRPGWRGLPNLLSLSRLPLGGLFWLVLDADTAPAHLVAPFLVLAAAAATDVLDGIFARRQGVIDGVGSWLDPICDKLFVGAVLGAILYHRQPPLMVPVLIVSRELLQLPLSLTYGFVPVLRHWLRYDFRASALGKAATVVQFLAVAALLVGDRRVIWPCAWLAFATGLLALADYLRRAVALGKSRLTAPTTRSPPAPRR